MSVAAAPQVVLVPPQKQELVACIHARLYQQEHHHRHKSFYLPEKNRNVLKVWRIRNALPNVIPENSMIQYPDESDPTSEEYVKWVCNTVLKGNTCSACNKKYTTVNRKPCSRCTLCLSCHKAKEKAFVILEREREEQRQIRARVARHIAYAIDTLEHHGMTVIRDKPSSRVVFPELTETDDETKCCKVCLTYESNTLLTPCNHMVCCSECVKHLKKCPVCRSGIVEVKPIFKS